MVMTVQGLNNRFVMSAGAPHCCRQWQDCSWIITILQSQVAPKPQLLP